MRVGRLTTEDGQLVADPTWWAESMREQGRGLLALPPLKTGQALLIPTRGVHTFGMAYSLDLLYLTRNLKVTDAVTNVRPGRMAPLRLRTRLVVELPEGALAGLPDLRGAQLRFEPRERA